MHITFLSCAHNCSHNGEKNSLPRYFDEKQLGAIGRLYVQLVG